MRAAAVHATITGNRSRATQGVLIMTRRRVVFVAAIALAACVSGLPLGTGGRALVAALPERLADRDFWKLSSEISEPNGTFRSDNLLSNEIFFQYVIPDLVKTTRPGRAYIGVGPEQNFTYIAAVKPRMAFIVDIRRGNLDQHLFYKALIEMSTSRLDFLSRLFARPAPDALAEKGTGLSPGALLDAFADVEASPERLGKNIGDIEKWLTEKHGFALTPDDLRGIEYVARAFYSEGP